MGTTTHTAVRKVVEIVIKDLTPSLSQYYYSKDLSRKNFANYNVSQGLVYVAGQVSELVADAAQGRELVADAAQVSQNRILALALKAKEIEVDKGVILALLNGLEESFWSEKSYAYSHFDLGWYNIHPSIDKILEPLGSVTIKDAELVSQVGNLDLNSTEITGFVEKLKVLYKENPEEPQQKAIESFFKKLSKAIELRKELDTAMTKYKNAYGDAHWYEQYHINANNNPLYERVAFGASGGAALGGLVPALIGALAGAAVTMIPYRNEADEYYKDVQKKLAEINAAS